MTLRKIFFFILLSLLLSSCSYNLVGLGSGSSLPLFSSNTDVFSGEQLFAVSLSDDVVSLTGNPHDLSGVFVHNVAYVGVTGWVPVELVPRGSSLSESWIQGPADASLTKDELVVLLNEQGIEEAEELYVLLYVCRLYDLGDEGFLDLITPAQKGVTEDLFDGVRGYLCGVERFTNDGIINHNLWSLATVDISSLVEDEDVVVLVDALCGGNAQEYSFAVSSWPNDDFCAQGTLQGSTPSFPEEGASVTWSCEGTDGGANTQCSASRNENPDFCANIPSLEEATNGLIVRTNDVLLLQPWDIRLPVNGFEFEEVFRLPFPGMIVQQRFRLHKNSYASMRFTTPDDFSSQHFGSVAPEVLAGTSSGVRLMSISRCEGDFDLDNLGPRCIRTIIGGDTFNWRGGDDGSPANCPLEPGTQYYMNIIYSHDPPGTVPADIRETCTHEIRCGNLLIPGNNYYGGS